MHEKYSIATTSMIPVRKEPTDKSEMISQVLFGEHFSVFEDFGKWNLIKNSFDNSTGWVHSNMTETISNDFYDYLNENDTYITDKVYIVNKIFERTPITVLPGSNLPLFNAEYKSFKIENETYKLYGNPSLRSDVITGEKIAERALNFLNAPFMWGGRSLYGVDSSGLVQIIFKINGINLSKDIVNQHNIGTEIEDFNEKEVGDVAYFSDNKNVIIHTGIIFEKDRIIHADGCVRFDKIDKTGIFDLNSKQKLFNLHSIVRFTE